MSQVSNRACVGLRASGLHKDVIMGLRASPFKACLPGPSQASGQTVSPRARRYEGRKSTPGEDKCFVISVSNWLKGTILSLLLSLWILPSVFMLLGKHWILISWQNIYAEISFTISSKRAHFVNINSAEFKSYGGRD